MELSTIVINTKEKHGTEIVVDGKKIKNARAFSLGQEVGETPVLKLEILVDNITINGDSIVNLTKVPSLAQGGILKHEDFFKLHIHGEPKDSKEVMEKTNKFNETINEAIRESIKQIREWGIKIGKSSKI